MPQEGTGPVEGSPVHPAVAGGSVFLWKDPLPPGGGGRACAALKCLPQWVKERRDWSGRGGQRYDRDELHARCTRQCLRGSPRQPHIYGHLNSVLCTEFYAMNEDAEGGGKAQPGERRGGRPRR